MKVKKIPMRTCVVTKEKCEKRDLIRVVRTPEKEVLLDPTGKMNGKGAYLKLDLDVILKAQKSKVLDRALDIEVPEMIYEELKNQVNNRK
ncbi:MAG: YlxR family protein [Bacilli bacterium]|jgi:predicted RNA-binding protein YlxR (DUF448 family)|nr:YlxR family protein [Bacilli bacterium]